MVVALVSCRNGPCRGCLLIYRSLFNIVWFLWLAGTTHLEELFPLFSLLPVSQSPHIKWFATVFYRYCFVNRVFQSRSRSRKLPHHFVGAEDPTSYIVQVFRKNTVHINSLSCCHGITVTLHPYDSVVLITWKNIIIFPEIITNSLLFQPFSMTTFCICFKIHVRSFIWIRDCTLQTS
jgi:hypothetical protein